MKKISVATVDVHNSGNMNSSFGTLKVINLDYYLQGLFLKTHLLGQHLPHMCLCFLAAIQCPLISGSKYFLLISRHFIL